MPKLFVNLPRKYLLISIIFGFMGALSASALYTQTTVAVSPSSFQAGRIIDDGIFYNKDAMGGVQNIQAFINAHTPSSCDTWGTAPSGVGGMTDAQYAQSQGWPGPPYVCLRNYYENPATGKTSFEMGGGAFTGGQSAAQIIYNASQQYGINPEVLLVTLRKESINLFGDSWPLKSQYAYSMGYACPDSGPNNSANCNASYAGFYNQINLAARQFSLYKNNITSYNYQPGRTNYIQYSPTASCGGANVYIQNVATASLYNYTPYTPNQASLNAYPGTATCGAYGNRNFWFFWQEWFGSPYIDQIVRTQSNPQLYLISGNVKYPVNSYDALSRLQVLSPGVGYVDQSYLDSFTTSTPINRTIRDPSTGNIYLIDSGYKLQFDSCDSMADYGLSCNNNPDLTPAQISSFATGPSLTPYMQTSPGRLFYIKDGKKSQVYNPGSLGDVRYNSLPDSSINNLPYGTPIISDNVLIQNAINGKLYYYYKGVASYLSGSFYYNQPAINSLPMRQLDEASINTLQVTTFNGLAKDSQSGTTSILGASSGKMDTTPYNVNGDYTTVAPTLISSIPSTSGVESYVKSANDSTIYDLSTGERRAVASWDDFSALNPSQKYFDINQTSLVAVPSSVQKAYKTGVLVKSSSSDDLYIIDSKSKLYVPTMNVATSIGAKITTLSASSIDSYSTASNLKYSLITATCDGSSNKYILADGKKIRLSSSVASSYGLTQDSLYAKLSSNTCTSISDSNSTLGSFIRDETTGAIYQVSGAKKTHIINYADYARLSAGTSGYVDVPSNIVSLIPGSS